METESILRKEGMNEKDIALVHEYDKEYFKSHRRYEEHRALENSEQILFYEDNIEEGMHFLDTIEDVELHRVLVSLKPEELKIIELHVIDGLTVTEIAKLQGKSKSTISEKIQRIFKKIKKFYKNPNKTHF